jgi:hypothetical protein
MCVRFFLLKITNNSSKFESNITALSNGKIVNKPKGYRFQIGDYLMYNKEKDFYYNISYAQIKNLYWNSEMIAVVGYVANDDINNNNNNGNKDKTSMIELSRSD